MVEISMDMLKGVIQFGTSRESWELVPCQIVGTIILVALCQGKLREKQNFLQVRELSGNFEKMSRNFVHLTNVREFCHDNYD